jgi:hypothetical protein
MQQSGAAGVTSAGISKSHLRASSTPSSITTRIRCGQAARWDAPVMVATGCAARSCLGAVGCSRLLAGSSRTSSCAHGRPVNPQGPVRCKPDSWPGPRQSPISCSCWPLPRWRSSSTTNSRSMGISESPDSPLALECCIDARATDPPRCSPLKGSDGVLPTSIEGVDTKVASRHPATGGWAHPRWHRGKTGRTPSSDGSSQTFLTPSGLRFRAFAEKAAPTRRTAVSSSTPRRVPGSTRSGTGPRVLGRFAALPAFAAV